MCDFMHRIDSGGIMSESIRIWFSSQVDGSFLMHPTTELFVTPGLAVEYGLVETGDPTGAPVVLDAVVAAHEFQLGDKFTPETCSDYLQMQSKHWLGLAFGRKAYFSGFTINGHYAYDLKSSYVDNKGYKGLSYDKARIKADDSVGMFAFQDSYGMDYYTYFMQNGRAITDLGLSPGKAVELELEGLMFGFGGPMTRKDRRAQRLISTVADGQIVTVDGQTGERTPLEGVMTDDDGKFEIAFDEPGVYYLSCDGGECRYASHLALPWLRVTVSEGGSEANRLRDIL